MIFFRKPVSTPHQVQGRLFRDHALVGGLVISDLYGADFALRVGYLINQPSSVASSAQVGR
jgi:hypothetical protein